jgi:biotin operon repressor
MGRQASGKRFAQRDKEMILEMRRDFHSIEKIAFDIGVTRKTVLSYLSSLRR